MFRIGEFSKLTQVSIRMLRHYDETDILKPARIDEFTGYRQYSIEQIAIINKIIFLRDSGFNVSEMASIINNWENNHIISQLRNKKLELEATIQSEKNRLNKIQYAIDNMHCDKKETNFNVILKHIPSYNILSLRRILPNYFAEKELYEELNCYIKNNKVKRASDFCFSMYHDVEYKERDVDVEICIIIKKMGKNNDDFTYRQSEEVPIMACTMVYGAYQNIAGAYLFFAEWLSNHKLYSMTNEASRQICHRGPWNEKNVDKYLTEIQIPIKKIIVDSHIM